MATAKRKRVMGGGRPVKRARGLAPQERPVYPGVLEVLEADGVPEARLDRGVVWVDGDAYSATKTNTVVSGGMLVSDDVNMQYLHRTFPCKATNNSLTVGFACPKGTVTVNNRTKPAISLLCNGSETVWGAVFHAHTIALALCDGGNPTVPYNIEPVHNGVCIKPVVRAGRTIDLDVAYRRYAGHAKVMRDEKNMRCCKLHIGGDENSAVLCAVYATGKATATGLPAGGCEKYMMLIARIVVHMYALSDQAADAGPSQ